MLILDIVAKFPIQILGILNQNSRDFEPRLNVVMKAHEPFRRRIIVNMYVHS